MNSGRGPLTQIRAPEILMRCLIKVTALKQSHLGCTASAVFKCNFLLSGRVELHLALERVAKMLEMKARDPAYLAPSPEPLLFFFFFSGMPNPSVQLTGTLISCRLSSLGTSTFSFSVPMQVSFPAGGFYNTSSLFLSYSGSLLWKPPPSPAVIFPGMCGGVNTHRFENGLY